MFVLMTIDEENHFQHLCYSKDRKKLEDMISEFEKSTQDQDGRLVDFNKLPKTISFGKFRLNKEIESSRIIKYYCSNFRIYCLFDKFYIYQVQSA
jgi:hypothetical protein